ncbi:MAG: arsenite efflux transporter metallochaperone ArsD [Actinomycetota bacterium]
MRVEIYDPAMCCSSGLCGPGVDPILVKVYDTMLALKEQGVEITRFNLAQQPKEFLDNKQVADLLQEKGNDVLPVIFVNGNIFETGEYPSYEDFCTALGIEPLE